MKGRGTNPPTGRRRYQRPIVERAAAGQDGERAEDPRGDEMIGPQATSYELMMARNRVADASQLLFWETIPSIAGRVEPLLSRLLHQLAPVISAADARSEVEIAVREALINAIRHGNQFDPKRRAEVRCFVENGDLLVVIADEGAGFDASCIPDPTADENLTRDCGRGLLLIRHFMDDVSFANGGREIRLRKHL
jgi:serine/threonine-protein kinase RsbW